MGYIARLIIEARIDYLTGERDKAIRNREYQRAWKLQTDIDKNINRMVRFSYYQLGV